MKNKEEEEKTKEKEQDEYERINNGRKNCRLRHHDLSSCCGCRETQGICVGGGGGGGGG